MMASGNPIRRVIVAAMFSAASALCAADLTLEDGTVLKNAEVVGINAGTLEIVYSGGGKKVSPENLSDADCKRYAEQISLCRELERNSRNRDTIKLPANTEFMPPAIPKPPDLQVARIEEKAQRIWPEQHLPGVTRFFRSLASSFGYYLGLN